MVITTASARVTVAALTLFFVACNSDQPTVCKSLPGTPEELAATPRDDANLELLALRLSKGITADEAVYQRLKRDIAVIRAQAPEVLEIRYFAPYDGHGINLILDEPRYANLLAGDDPQWACLNRHLGAVRTSPSEGNIATIEFKGRLKLETVAPAYQRVEGVTVAEPVHTVGDGPTIHVTPQGDTWHYVFDAASGDCSRGCMQHIAYYFSVDSKGKGTLVGKWDSTDATATRPAWVDLYMHKAASNWMPSSF